MIVIKEKKDTRVKRGPTCTRPFVVHAKYTFETSLPGQRNFDLNESQVSSASVACDEHLRTNKEQEANTQSFAHTYVRPERLCLKLKIVSPVFVCVCVCTCVCLHTFTCL